MEGDRGLITPAAEPSICSGKILAAGSLQSGIWHRIIKDNREGANRNE